MYQTIAGDIIFATLFIFFLAAIFFAWFFIHRTRERERLLLIEKGVDPSQLPETKNFGFNFSFPWLKIGIVITSTSFGIIIGILLVEGIGIDDEIIPILMFLFGGIGMIIAHYIDRSTENVDKPAEKK